MFMTSRPFHALLAIVFPNITQHTPPLKFGRSVFAFPPPFQTNTCLLFKIFSAPLLSSILLPSLPIPPSYLLPFPFLSHQSTPWLYKRESFLICMLLKCKSIDPKSNPQISSNLSFQHFVLKSVVFSTLHPTETVLYIS